MSTPAVEVTAVASASANPIWTTYVIPVMSMAAGSLATVGASWIGKRAHPKIVQAETSERIANAFDGLVDRLQADNKRLDARLDEAEAKIGQLRRDLHKRNDWIQALQGWYRRMLDHVTAQNVLIAKLGGEPLKPPPLPDLPELGEPAT